MAVLLTDENKQNFKAQLSNLDQYTKELFEKTKNASDLLTNDVASRFKNAYSAGKTITEQLMQVLETIDKQKSDLTKLITDLGNYAGVKFESALK